MCRDHPWPPARGICHRVVEDGHFPGRQIHSEVIWCVITMISAGGFSAYQVASGSNPANLFGWEAKDEDLTITEDTGLPGRFAHQWKLRMRPQEAALKEAANCKLRRLLA